MNIIENAVYFMLDKLKIEMGFHEMKNTALQYFTAVPKQHNCAQAVAAGAGREDLVCSLGSCGGGRAPEGFCGALYAALLLAPETEHEKIRTSVQAAAGALTCREIKSAAQVSCAECVRIAAQLTEPFLSGEKEA